VHALPPAVSRQNGGLLKNLGRTKSKPKGQQFCGRLPRFTRPRRRQNENGTNDAAEAEAAVPRGLVEFRADPASAMHDAAFDRAKTVIAYCASGGRSALVGKTLKDMGYSNVRNLGGFKGWLKAGGDVEKA